MKPPPAVAADVLHVRVGRLVADAVFVPHVRVGLQLLLFNIEAWPAEVYLPVGHPQLTILLHWDDRCLGLDALDVEVYFLFRGEDLGLWYEVSVVGQDAGGQVGFLVDLEDLYEAFGVIFVVAFGVAFGVAFWVTFRIFVLIGGYDDFVELCDVFFTELAGVQFDELADCVDGVLMFDFVGVSLVWKEVLGAGVIFYLLVEFLESDLFLDDILSVKDRLA